MKSKLTWVPYAVLGGAKLLDGDIQVGRVSQGGLGWIATVREVSTLGFESEKSAKAYVTREYKRKHK